MGNAKIYNPDRKPLAELLEQITAPKGATLRIPNLQRPFVWHPNEVVLLIDTLLRGWPFGTLLLWKIDMNESDSMIPSREFWKLVDRTLEEDSLPTEGQHPPAQFRMVLDGQQRLQSLVLAVGGDDYGFRLSDAEWFRAKEDSPKRGRPTKHWTQAELFLDLPNYTEQFQITNNPRDVDYQQALKWVVSDPEKGRSMTKQPSNYNYPIPLRSKDTGQFVRFSRLWNLALPKLSFALLREPVSNLLKSYKTSEESHQKDADAVKELILLLADVKKEDVSFLELQPFVGPDMGEQEDYNEAVVSIFTRLNKSGQPLTDQEISFAWIKTNWDATLTKGLQADKCFSELRKELEDEYDLKVSDDDVVRIASVCWSALFGNGQLLGKRDLLKPDRVKRLAVDLNKQWDMVEESVVCVASRLIDAGFKHREHYESLNAVIVLIAWRAVALKWATDHNKAMKEPERVGYQTQIKNIFDAVVVRWFAVTQWGRAWSGLSGKPFEEMVRELSQLQEKLSKITEYAKATTELAKLLDEWMNRFADEAVSLIESLDASRDQVAVYYLPLWVWHHLDKARWDASKLTLPAKRSKTKVKTAVDHVVAVKLWDTKLKSEPKERKTELEPVVNQIGNCWLMETNYNSSKSDKPLNFFLKDVLEFVDGTLKLETWSKAVAISSDLLDPTNAKNDDIRAAIEERTALVKSEIKAFIRGEKSLVLSPESA